MHPHERELALKYLVRELDKPKIFISGPIHGTSVFGVPCLREAELFDTLNRLGYKNCEVQPLNFVGGFKIPDTWWKGMRAKWQLRNDRQFRENALTKSFIIFGPNTLASTTLSQIEPVLNRAGSRHSQAP
jgi:hypothetical protein